MTATVSATTAAADTAPKGQGKAIDKPNDTGKVLKRLLGYMVTPETRGKFALATVARVIALMALVAMPFITGQAINVITDGGSTDELLNWVIIGAVAGGVYLLVSFVADRMYGQLATQGVFNLQVGVFRHLKTLSMGFFFKTPVGELLSRVNNDAEVVAQFFESAVAQLLRAGIMPLMLVAVMLIIDLPLTLVALLVVPIIIIAMVAITRATAPSFAMLQQELGEASGFQEETLAGHKVIISKRRQSWAEATNEGNAANVFHVGSKAWFPALMQFPFTMTLTYTQIVLVLVVGALMVIEGEVTVGTVMALVGYAGLMASPLSQISNLMSSALNAAAGGRRIFEVLDSEPTVTDAPDAKDYEFKGGRIEFKNVDFGYAPGRLILKDNTFVAEAGESIGICGPTGAGESTIVNIPTRYYDLDGGAILIDGQDISKLTRTSLRRQIGAVLQEAFLFTDTVMNNLRYAREGATTRSASRRPRRPTPMSSSRTCRRATTRCSPSAVPI